MQRKGKCLRSGTNVSAADGIPLDFMVWMAESGNDVAVINQQQESIF